VADRPRSRLEIRDFPGLFSRPDAADLPPGAASDQKNLQSAREGELRSRAGLEPVVFEEE
jgi:hypothetical protein